MFFLLFSYFFPTSPYLNWVFPYFPFWGRIRNELWVHRTETSGWEECTLWRPSHPGCDRWRRAAGSGAQCPTKGLTLLVGTKPRVANPRVGSGTGFGGPGGGSGGPGGGFVLVIQAMAKPLLRLLRRNHRQDHQNHHQDHQNHYQNPLGGYPLRG